MVKLQPIQVFVIADITLTVNSLHDLILELQREDTTVREPNFFSGNVGLEDCVVTV